MILNVIWIICCCTHYFIDYVSHDYATNRQSLLVLSNYTAENKQDSVTSLYSQNINLQDFNLAVCLNWVTRFQWFSCIEQNNFVAQRKWTSFHSKTVYNGEILKNAPLLNRSFPVVRGRDYNQVFKCMQ